MTLKQIILSVLFIAIGLTIFNSCDKIEEPYFKPVYTERTVFAEYIADAENLNSDNYNDFVNLYTGNDKVAPMIVLSGNTSINGNSEAAKAIVDKFQFATDGTIASFNRIEPVVDSIWETKLNSELDKKGEFNLNADGQLDFSNNTYTGTYTISSLNGIDSPLKLKAYLLEDSITVNGTLISNVLRSEMLDLNIADGMQREESKNGDFTLDLSSYDLIKLYAFNYKLVFALENATTHEILQASKLTIGLNFSKKQNILIEDFTGHQCGNCPLAHEELTNLISVHGSQIKGMAIHYAYFASLDVPNGYVNDFTTEVGTAIGDEFVGQFAPLPLGLVNRMGEGDKSSEPSAWDAIISQIINNNPKVGIALNVELENQTINADVFVKAFQQIDTLLKVQAFITESHIISQQLMYHPETHVITDYEHNHVLRASMNGNWGEDLTSVPFSQNQVINHTLSIDVDSEWNTDNLSVIVIVYNNVTKEIFK